jgi:hypothetical protein
LPDLAALPALAAAPTRSRAVALARASQSARSMTNKMIVSCLMSIVIAAGCSKKSGSCEEVYDHTVSLLPAEMKDQMAGQKEQAIAKCEKLPEEARKCAMDASSLDELMKCPKK